MSYVKKAASVQRYRRYLIAVFLVCMAAAAATALGVTSTPRVAVGVAVAATNDTCGYDPTAAPKPGGGTATFDENTVTRSVAVYGNGSTAHIGAFASDETGLFVGTGGSAWQSAGTFKLNQTLTKGLKYPSSGTGSYSLAVSGLNVNVAVNDTITLTNSLNASQTLTETVAANAGDSFITVKAFSAGQNFAPGDSATDTKVTYGELHRPPLTLGQGSDTQGRLQAPTIYLTDITNNSAANSGDWEQGGTPANSTGGTNVFADGIYGFWQNVISGSKPSANGWNLGPNADTPPSGTTSYNDGYGTEVSWNVNNLTFPGGGFTAGHTYRVQVITHDADQNKLSGAGDTGEVCTTIAFPGITTVAHGGMFAADGSLAVTDTVSVGGVSPTNSAGHLHVAIYGPNDSSCSTVKSSKDIPLSQVSGDVNHDYNTSPDFAVTKKGTYRFTADLYQGSGAGTLVASSACNADNEMADANPRPTTLTTDAGGPYQPRASLTDTATLSGGTSDATGTITFELFRDNGSGGCGTSLGTDTATVNGGDGKQYTGTVSIPGPGTYHWAASYTGDDKNGNSSSSCGATGENPVVLNPSITVAKTPDNQTIETGTKASFHIVVTNNGTATLTHVNVSDANSPDCNRSDLGTLTPGQSTSYDCMSPTLTDDLHNVAHASGTSGNTTVSADDDADVDVIHPIIDVQKDPPSQSVAFDGTANFTITVTNIGDVRLTGIVTGDGLAPDCIRTATQTAALAAAKYGAGHGYLDPGESFSYACSLAHVQAAFTNIITACGNDRLGATACDNDNNGGPPGPGCPEANRCASVYIETLSSTQTILPNDTATVDTGGGPAPNGDLSFRLYKGTCDPGNLVKDFGAVPVNGSGSASTSNTTFTVSGNGTYNWQTNYSGDTNGNASFQGPCGKENFTIDNGH